MSAPSRGWRGQRRHSGSDQERAELLRCDSSSSFSCDADVEGRSPTGSPLAGAGPSSPTATCRLGLARGLQRIPDSEDDSSDGFEERAPRRGLCYRRLPAATAVFGVAALLLTWRSRQSAVGSSSSAAGPDRSGGESGVRAGAELDGRVSLTGDSDAGECHDAVDGDPCYESVAWAKWHGIAADPEGYSPCTPASSLAEIQAWLHRVRPEHCPVPCAKVPPPSASTAPSTSTSTPSSSSSSSPTTTTAAPTTTTTTKATESTTTPATTTTESSESSSKKSGKTSSSSSSSSSEEEDEKSPCHDSEDGEVCHDSVHWVMTSGIWAHPEWYPNLTVNSPFEAFQEVLYSQGHGDCKRPCKAVDIAHEQRQRDLHGVFGGRKLNSFYVYRAQSEENYPLENVNVADLPGVMWYLHNEIIPSKSPINRKYNITRILRFRILMKTTKAFFDVHHRQFSGFAAFDNGHCTVPNCDQVWAHYGFIVGCQFQQSDTASYLSSWRTRLDGNCKDPFCNSSIWYSLPGPCPSSPFTSKSEACVARDPGGLCDSATGERDCTYSVEPAGEINLDDLSGIGNYKEFKKSGNQEYNLDIDGGVGNSFWDGKRDIEKCKARTDRVKQMFKEKYPDLPDCDSLAEPPCDFDGFYQNELLTPPVKTAEAVVKK